MSHRWSRKVLSVRSDARRGRHWPPGRMASGSPLRPTPGWNAGGLDSALALSVRRPALRPPFTTPVEGTSLCRVQRILRDLDPVGDHAQRLARTEIAALQAASAQKRRSMGFHPNCIASHSMSLRSLRAFGSARRTACLTAPGQSFACRTARSMRCRCNCLGSGPRPDRLNRPERMRQAARFSQRCPARSSYQAASNKRVTPQASTGPQGSPGHGRLPAGT